MAADGGLDLESFCRDHLPGGSIREGRNGPEWWVACPFHPDKEPSFSVSLETGVYHCFACGEGGGFKRLVEHLGLDWQEIKERYGSSNGTRPPRKKAKVVIFPKELERTWKTLDPDDSLALAYLQRRGLPFTKLPPYCRGGADPNTRDNTPALFIKRVDSDGAIRSILRIRLSPSAEKLGPKKNWPGTRAKATFAFIGCDLQDLPSLDEVALCEGYETGGGVFFGCGLPVVVCFSAENLVQAAKKLPFKEGARVIIFADKDRPSKGDTVGPGEKWARRAMEVLKARGLRATYVLPPLEIPEDDKGVDFLDAYTKDPSLVKKAYDEALQELEGQTEEEDPPAEEVKKSPCGRYGIKGSSFWTLTKEGGLKERVSNFTCEILEDLEIKVGEGEVHKYFRIWATLEDGIEKTFLLPASSYYEPLKWIKTYIGAKARIFPGVSGRRFCDCVDSFSNPKQVVEVGRSGWVCEGGRWRFVFPGPHAKDLLGLGRFPYGVPEKPDPGLAREAAPFLFKLPPAVVSGLLGAIAFATLRESWRQAGVFQGTTYLLVGRRNTFKTTTALAFLSLLGRDWARTAPETFGTATVNRILTIGYYFKDLPLLLDDFFPGTNPEENRRLFETLDRLIRVCGNASERGRLTANSALDRGKPFEAVPVITAEFLPVLSESSLSRTIIIPHVRSDLEDLEALQDQAEGLNHLGGLWLRYLSEKAPELPEYLRRQLREKRKSPHLEPLREQELFRAVDNFTILDTSLGVFLDFLDSLGLDISQPARTLALGLKELLSAFLGRAQETDTVELFLESLREVLASGQALIPAKEEYQEDLRKPVIGVLSGEEAWLFPQSTEKELNAHLSKLNRPPIRLGRAFYAELKKRGLLAWEVPTKVVKLGGRSQRVLGLKREILGGDDEDVPF